MKRLMLTMLMASGLAMADPECSLQTLRGTYVVSYAGFAITASGPTYGTTLGVLSIDPRQAPNVTGAATFAFALFASMPGFPTLLFVPAAGTVQINPDCTGTLSIGAQGTPPTEIDQIFYDQNTKTILTLPVRLDPAFRTPALLGTWNKISPTPGVATWPAPPPQ